jgi:phospholipase C
VAEGDRLIASVYNAVRANEELWASTLLIVLFDEHGGFYDHVTPPAAVPPDHHVEEYSFDQLGLRVPAILVSPYVKKASVLPTTFDHTSILRYLTDKWSLGPLGFRTEKANTFSQAIGTNKRNDAPAKLPLSGPNPLPVAPLSMRPSLSGHQSALFAMTQLLESMTSVEESALLGRTKRMITGFDGAVDVAMERVGEFLGAQA